MTAAVATAAAAAAPAAAVATLLGVVVATVAMLLEAALGIGWKRFHFLEVGSFLICVVRTRQLVYK